MGRLKKESLYRPGDGVTDSHEIDVRANIEMEQLAKNLNKPLEERLVGAVISFANERELGYGIQKDKPGSSGVIEISVSRDSGKQMAFRHYVQIKNDALVGQGVMHVGDKREDRRDYLAFLTYLNKINGIQLTNGFASTWAQKPTRYPV